MNNVLIACVVTVFFLMGMIIWLVFQIIQLKQTAKQLAASVECNKQDIAGLSSAAVSVDKKMNEQVGYLKRIVDHIQSLEGDVQKNVEITGPYGDAIEWIKQGAEVQQLVDEFAISREEAELLFRLHKNS